MVKMMYLNMPYQIAQFTDVLCLNQGQMEQAQAVNTQAASLTAFLQETTLVKNLAAVRETVPTRG